MLDDARMTIAPRCHQHPVRHFPAIVEDRIPESAVMLPSASCTIKLAA
jgi:hypothetical protein